MIENVVRIFYGAVGLIGAGLVWIGIDLLMCWFRYWRSRKWCEKRGLKIGKVELPDGRYGYVGYDYANLKAYGIPNDYGEPDETRIAPLRVKDFSWEGKDKLAIDEDGNEIRIG